MRSSLENNKATNLHVQSMRVGFVEMTLSDNMAISADGPLFYFLNPDGVSRDVTLPPVGAGGGMFGICNQGASANLVVKNQVGTTILTLATAQSGIFVSSRTVWDFFSYSTSGGGESTTMSSADSSIGITKLLDNFDIIVTEANVDHDALSNFVADEHIAHSGVTFTAGDGLIGGGTIAASRSLAVGITNATDKTTPVGTDELLLADSAVAGAIKKSDITAIVGLADHDALTNFVADEHIAHSGVSMTGGTGISGGGAIDASRTFNIDLTSLTADTPVGADELFFYDVGGVDYNKVTLTNLITVIDGLSSHLTNVVEDTTPQLGGMLDVNGQSLGDGTLALLTFTEDASAVNNVEVENEATGSPPVIRAVGTDTNIDLLLEGKGSGVVKATNIEVAATGSVGVVERTTVAEVRDPSIDGKFPSNKDLYDAAAEVTLTDAASITVDFDAFINAKVTLAGNRTLANPTNEVVGKTGFIRAIQDATGSRTLAFGTDWEFAGGTAPTLTTTAAAEDMLFYQIIAANRVLVSAVLDVK